MNLKNCKYRIKEFNWNIMTINRSVEKVTHFSPTEDEEAKMAVLVHNLNGIFWAMEGKYAEVCGLRINSDKQ